MKLLRRDILAELLTITDEEKAILEQRSCLNKELYTSGKSFIIESDKFLSRNKMIMIRKHTRFVDFPLHKHDYIEVSYVYNGHLYQKIGGRTIHLKKGELILLNQHIEHEILASTHEDIVINLIIRPAFFEFIFSFLSSENIISDFLLSSLYNQTQTGQYLYFKVSSDPSIQNIIGIMIREFMEPSAFSDSTIKLYMGLLMIELIKKSHKVEREGGSGANHYLIFESLKYIEENFKEASLFELAEQLNQSHYGLSKMIKKSTSYTFKELLQERRLEKAKELLEGTGMPISNVAEQVGYNNLSYFYRIFKDKYSKTPKEYRQRGSCSIK